MSRWYAVNTLPHQETRAILNLDRQGYDAFLPVHRKTRRHARRIDTIRAALFPSYLFVRLDTTREGWSPINSTYGVRRLVCQNGMPAALPEGFVEGLREAVDEEGFTVEDVERMKIGDRLRVLAGPFADTIGTLIRLPDRDRIALLLGVLGRDVRVVLPRNLVSAA